MSELRGLGAIIDGLKECGVRTYAVAADPVEQSCRVVEKHGLAFPILSDFEARVIREYGLLHARGGPRGADIAIPAYLLVGRDGRVLWRRVARLIQDRPDAAEVLAEVRERVER